MLSKAKCLLMLLTSTCMLQGFATAASERYRSKIRSIICFTVASPRAGDSLKMSANIAMYNDDSTTPLPFKFLNAWDIFVCLFAISGLYIYKCFHESLNMFCHGRMIYI